MRNICITPKGIKKLLQNLKPNKAAGQDEIWVKLLKEYHTCSLRYIYNITLHTHSPQRLENGNDHCRLQEGWQGQSYQLLPNLTHMYL